MARNSLHNRQGRRVGPACNPSDLIEIRPNRNLYIKRVNPRQRDDKFEKEMQVYLQYRENGLITGHMLGNQKRQKSTVKKTVVTQEETGRPGEVVDITEEVMKEAEVDIPEESLGNLSNHLHLSPNKSESASASPSRGSMASRTQSVQSAAGINVTVGRPVSDYQPMAGIVESENKENSVCSKGRDTPDSHVDSNQSRSSKTPRKTKGHRPLSAKNIQKAKSIASSDISDNLKNISDPELEYDLNIHKNSIFKDVTLFFIHGVGGSSDVWNAQIQFFSDLGLEIVAPDLIGHGFSKSPDNARAYHFNEILADLEATFDKFCKKQNIIIGHSYGCAFAAALGRRRARRVTKLVLISGGAPVPLAPQPGVFMLPVCMLSCIKPCLFSKFERNAFHNLKDSGLSKDIAFDVPTYVLSHMMNGQDWLDGDMLYHQWLSMPTLLLHGKHDKFVSVEEEQFMEKAVYLSKLIVVDDCSHMLMMEKPHEINQMMYNFIFSEQSKEQDTPVGPSEYSSPAQSARRAKSAKSSKQLA